MGHDWILDVLTDLQNFAQANGLSALAEQLDETHRVAQIDIASHAKGDGSGLYGEDAFTGRATRRAGIR